jgi:hypothetical protein
MHTKHPAPNTVATNGKINNINKEYKHLNIMILLGKGVSQNLFKKNKAKLNT